jgi:hypothetical protein
MKLPGMGHDRGKLLMKRPYGLLILLTTIIVPALAYNIAIMGRFHASRLPHIIRIVDAHTAVVTPVRGFALPQGLHAGMRINLAEQPPASRIVIAELQPGNGRLWPPGQVYTFMVEDGGALIPAQVATPSSGATPGGGLTQWLFYFESLFTGAIALTVVWRGRNMAAVGLALFAIAYLLGRTAALIPSQGSVGLVALMGAWALYLLARVGMYVMAESMAAAALSSRARLWWRGSFLLVLGAGALIAMGGPVIYVTTGWAELLRSGYSPIVTASYLVPVVLLFVSYHRAAAAHRLRLRWMLWSSGLFAVAMALANAGLPSETIFLLPLSAGLGGFLYAILRHRVVDLRVVFSQTLVYAITTSLVLGLFALFESLIERTTLGRDAGLMLELLVPLALGASLSAVHRRIDNTVDRLIFRRQYREEMALRRFASESAFVTQPEALLDMTVEQVHRHVGAPWVAYYELTTAGYARVRQCGEHSLPQLVATDDLALVKLRAHNSEVDLDEAPSGLGRDGYAFPLRTRGHLLGVLLVGPRPDEHYAAEERELMAHVAHAVSASLFALRAQVTEEQLTAARAEVEASAARLDVVYAQARASEALLKDSHARESMLLGALRALGAESRA